MKIDFYLRYHTVIGQSLYIVGNLGVLGNNDVNHAHPMDFLSEDYWHASIEIDELFNDTIEYRYVFKSEKNDLLIDGEKHRTIKQNGKDVITIDSWIAGGEYATVFYSAPFQNVFFKDQKHIKFKPAEFFTHIFKIKAPLLKESETVCLLGSTPELKNWQTALRSTA